MGSQKVDISRGRLLFSERLLYGFSEIYETARVDDFLSKDVDNGNLFGFLHRLPGDTSIEV